MKKFGSFQLFALSLWTGEIKRKKKLKFFEIMGYKNETTLIFSERLKEIMKFMKRKLLTMLLLVAGATVCAQQKLTKSTSVPLNFRDLKIS